MLDTVAVADLVLDRLRMLPRIEVLDGEVKKTPAGAYVVFYDDAPRLSSRTLAGRANRAAWRLQTVCVGRDAAETRWVVGQILSTLTNWRPLQDRAASWITPQSDGAPILRDDSVAGDIRFSQTLTFRLTTTRS
ncbi:hypothetical protein GCM10009616_35770 [Microlunatus lacustris]